MKKIEIHIIILLVIIGFSCRRSYEYYDENKQVTTNDNMEIFELNDKAVRLIDLSIIEPNSKDSLLQLAIYYLDKCISLDSTDHYTYLNKATIFILLRRYDDAKKLLENYLERQRHPGVIFFLGLINQHEESYKLAKERYIESLKLYDDLIRSNKSTISDEINREYVNMFLIGKEKALKNIKVRIKQGSNNKHLKFIFKVIKSTDETEIMNKLFKNTS